MCARTRASEKKKAHRSACFTDIFVTSAREKAGNQYSFHGQTVTDSEKRNIANRANLVFFEVSEKSSGRGCEPLHFYIARYRDLLKPASSYVLPPSISRASLTLLTGVANTLRLGCASTKL